VSDVTQLVHPAECLRTRPPRPVPSPCRSAGNCSARCFWPVWCGAFQPGLLAIFLAVATSTPFINFTFTAFTLVNASVVFHYARQRRAGHQLNPVSYPVVPAVTALTCSPS
jgi:hypothetical protein